MKTTGTNIWRNCSSGQERETGNIDVVDMIKAARRIVEKLRSSGYQAFFAGGWVRDMLLQKEPKDIDIATSAPPDEVTRLFPQSKQIGAQFGVIQVQAYGRTFEVATFRSDDAYLDGRNPSSITFSGPEQDALRRDFTINGLFYDPVADNVIDYVHGQADIRDRIVRTIGDPSARFSEDRLRMLRAIRLACSLGFMIASETWDAIRQLSPGILQVSWERIRDEFIRIFTGPDPGRGLDLLHQSGLLKHTIPELEAMEASSTSVLASTREALSLLERPSIPLAIGTLLHRTDQTEGTAEEICRRLKMSNDETGQIVDLVESQSAFRRAEEMRKSALIRLLRKSNIEDHLELLRVTSLSGRRGLETYRCCRTKLQEYGSELHMLPLVNGEDLKELGYVPGPVFRQILESVEDLQLEGALKSREEALAHITTAFPIEGNAGEDPRA